MADSLGALSLPAAAPVVYPPTDRTRAPGDPALVTLASFAATVLQADLGEAWTALSPGKPPIVDAVDGTRDGDTSARRCFFSDPRRGYFEPSDLPGLFVYRAAQSTSQWLAADCQRLRSQIVVTWLAPPADADPQHRERDSFLHAIRSSLHVALSQRRHPAWVQDSDQADADALKTSFATSTSPVTITSFDGALAAELLRTGRPITITTAPALGAYNTTDPIPITGMLDSSLAHTEQVYLTEADGGETVTTIFPFVSPGSVALPEMLTTGGSIEVGYGAAPDIRKGSLLQRACAFREMWFRRAQTGPIQIERADGTRHAFEAVEFFVDVSEDSTIDLAIRAFDPWDVEAHGTRSLPSDDVFEIIIED